MTRRVGVLVLIAACAGASCGEPGPGGRSSSSNVLIEISPTRRGERVMLPTDLGDVVVDAATFWIDELRLIGDQGVADDRTRVADRLLDLRARSTIALPDAPPGLYSRLRIALKAPDEQDRGAGPGFEGEQAAFGITGRLAGGRPVIVRDDHLLELDLRAGDGMELAPGQRLTVSLELDLADWFARLDLASLDGGIVIVDDERNQDRLQRFRENLVRSARLTLGRPVPSVTATR